MSSSSSPPFDSNVNFSGGRKTHESQVVIIAVLGAAVAGCAIGWSSPALSLLCETKSRPNGSNQETQTIDETSERISENLCNWISSLLPLGAAFGSLLGSLSVSYFGCKGSMIANSSLFALTFLSLSFGNRNVPALLFGRLSNGLSTGLSCICIPTYVSEISSRNSRGKNGFAFQVFICLGIAFIGGIGAFGSLAWLSTAPILISALHSGLLFLIPESPLYHVRRREFVEAKKALQYLRETDSVDVELQEMLNVIETVERTRESSSPFRDLLFSSTNLKALFVGLLLMFGQQFCGINAILFNSVSIFENAHFGLNSFLSSTLVISAMALSTFGASFLVDKLGRRILLHISSLFMALSISALGLYFYFHSEGGRKNDGEDEEVGVLNTLFSLLPLISLMVYVSVFSIGFGPLPWLMNSELFPLQVQSLASSISAFFNWSCAFIVTMFYNPVQNAIGLSWTFFGFGIIISFVFVLCFLFVPETKGKTLEEISSVFRRGFFGGFDNEERNVREDEILDNSNIDDEIFLTKEN